MVWRVMVVDWSPLPSVWYVEGGEPSPKIPSTCETYSQYADDDRICLQEWLSRAGDLPLCIRLVHFLGEHVEELIDNHHFLLPIIDVLNRYMHRCRVLSLSIPAWILPRVELPAHTLCTQLEAFSFSPLAPEHTLTPPPSLQLAFGPGSWLGQTPKLKELSLWGPEFGTQSILIPIDYSSLERLQLTYLRTNEFLFILSQASRIRQAYFSYIDSNDDNPDITSSDLLSNIVPNSLQALDLKVFCSDLLNQFSCPSLTTPNWCSYHLGSTVYTNDNDLKSFVNRSASISHLTSITIDPVINIDLIGLVAILPSLVKLSFGNTDDIATPTELFRRMRKSWEDANEDLGPFLPELRHLSFVGQKNFPWYLIFDLLSCRPHQDDTPSLYNINFRVSTVENQPISHVYIPKQTLYGFYDHRSNGVGVVRDELGRDLLAVSSRHHRKVINSNLHRRVADEIDSDYLPEQYRGEPFLYEDW